MTFPRFIKLFILFILIAATNSCVDFFHSNVVTFYEGPLPSGETIRIEPIHPELIQSLEFKQYAILLSEELRKIGYSPVTPSNIFIDVDLIAEVNYSIIKAPVDLRVERNSPFSHYHFYHGRYNDPYYYGIHTGWIDRVYIGVPYVRSLQLNIVKATDERDRIFEGRVESTGNQNQLPEIMPYLITALFSNFPGESGVTKIVTIEMDE